MGQFDQQNSLILCKFPHFLTSSKIKSVLIDRIFLPLHRIGRHKLIVIVVINSAVGYIAFNGKHTIINKNKQ